MTFIKRTIRPIVFSALSILGGITLGATLVGAVTTISTNIATDGTLAVTGLSTLTAGFVSQASSTVVGAFTATGAAALGSTLNVTGATTLASTTATGLKVGQVGTRHTGILSGYCTIAAGGHTATTTKQFTCAGATGITSSYKVFVQATSSMPSMFVVQSATSTTDAIEVRIFNTGLGTTTAGGLEGPTSLNFWAVL